jgi:hypothetical protein
VAQFVPPSGAVNERNLKGKIEKKMNLAGLIMAEAAEDELNAEDKSDRKDRLKIDLRKPTAPRKNETGAATPLPEVKTTESETRLLGIVLAVLVALGFAAIQWGGVNL